MYCHSHPQTGGCGRAGTVLSQQQEQKELFVHFEANPSAFCIAARLRAPFRSRYRDLSCLNTTSKRQCRLSTSQCLLAISVLSIHLLQAHLRAKKFRTWIHLSLTIFGAVPRLFVPLLWLLPDPIVQLPLIALSRQLQKHL